MMTSTLINAMYRQFGSFERPVKERERQTNHNFSI